MARDDLDRRLLNDYQRNFPLVARPFRAIGTDLGAEEDEVIARMRLLAASGLVGRIGAMIRPNAVGASTLAALAVPEDRLEAVADIISAQPEVNHNYEREHRLNLWFVVTAEDRESVRRVIKRIERLTGLVVLDLPLQRAFRVDLGFPLP